MPTTKKCFFTLVSVRLREEPSFDGEEKGQITSDELLNAHTDTVRAVGMPLCLAQGVLGDMGSQQYVKPSVYAAPSEKVTSSRMNS